MNGETKGAALLDIIQRTLDQHITPVLAGEARYRALMVASAVRMAMREIEQAGALDASLSGIVEAAGMTLGRPMSSVPDLCAALRSGALRQNAGLHQALWTHAVLAASITKPSALSRIEKRMAGMPDDRMELP